jgi:putative polyhydroxyalkanoate system protein
MADISIRRAHGMTVKKAKEAAQEVAEHLDERFDLESEWDGNTLTFRRHGVSGQLVVDKTHIAIDITLGFLLRAFKGSFVSEIEKNLDEMFG